MPESTDIVDTETEEVSGPATHPGSELPRLVEGVSLVSADEMDAARAAHLRFRFGRTVSGSGLTPIDGFTPIHLYPLLTFERVRSDYPIVLPADGTRPVSLTSVIDDLNERSAAEGDDRHHAQRSVLRLEAAMRRRVDTDREFQLSSLWNAALEQLESHVSPDERDSVLAHLQNARAALKVSGSVLPFGREAALALLRRANARFTSGQTGLLQEELEHLSQSTRALLDIDQSERPDAHTPDVLEQSVGEAFSDELDFDALSHLMDKGPHGPMLSDERRSRIESILAVLSDQLTVLRDAAADEETVRTISSPDELADVMDLHRRRCLELVKAVQMARLETSNQYDEEHHSPQFEAFGVDKLSTSDLASLPVVPVVVNGSDVSGIESYLQTCLDSAEPVKVVLMVDSALPADGRIGVATPVGLRLLAGGRPQSAIFQVSLSDLDGVTDAFDDALAFAGPAVVCLYVGTEFGARVNDGLSSAAFHPYLRAAAASDARVFPSFSNNPQNGTGWAGRFKIDSNVEAEQSWPISTVRYLDHEGSETEETCAFTAADFMAMDARFYKAFRQIPQEHWHEDLVPLHDFLMLDDRASSVPFILMVGVDGKLSRVICSEKIVELTEQVGSRWRSLQELGGIENSYAHRLLEVEKQRMEEESRIRVEEVEAKLKAELEQKTGTLAEQIVSNIASGLLGADLTAAPSTRQTSIPAPASAAPENAAAVEEAPAAAVEEPSQEEDEDELSFDEAYIETPRCTTCDECTTINPRLFAYDENKQAYIVDITAGTFREMVLAAEKCPVKIIHTGKPQNPDEPHLDELMARAEAFR